MTLLPMCDWAYWLAYDKKIFGKGDLSNIWQRLLPRLVFKSVCISFCLDFLYLFLCSTWEETWKLSGDSPEEAEFCQWPFEWLVRVYWKCPFLLPSKEIKPVNPKGNQLPILWLPDVKIQLIEKDPVAGKDWRQEKGLTEVEMVGWRHQINGYEFEQAPRDRERQGSVAVPEVAKSWTRLSHQTMSNLP